MYVSEVKSAFFQYFFHSTARKIVAQIILLKKIWLLKYSQ